LKAIYSLCHELKTNVRPCEDGVLVYDNMARTTHLIHLGVWDFFVSLLQANPVVIECDLSELKADMPMDGHSRVVMLNALERAGLIMRC
jgi:hypothetical protein